MKQTIFLLLISSILYLTDSTCCYRTQMYWAADSCWPYQNDNYYQGSGMEGDISGLVIPTRCKAKVCGDGRVVKDGFWCGKGRCNAAGCNCDGGCIEGDAEANFRRLSGIESAAGGFAVLDPSTWLG